MWLADSISVWALVFVFFTAEWAPILKVQLRRFWNLKLGFGQGNWFFWKLKGFYHFELVFGEANWRRRFKGRLNLICPETEEVLTPLPCPWRSELTMSDMGEVSFLAWRLLMALCQVGFATRPQLFASVLVNPKQIGLETNGSLRCLQPDQVWSAIPDWWRCRPWKTCCK